MPRIVFYVQHLLGIGHLKRAATLGRGLVDQGFEVTLVSGGRPVPGLDTGSARFVQLPPARAVDIYFRKLVDEHDRPIDDAWRARRRAALLCAFSDARPDVLMTELFPFGRRQFRFELLPLLERVRSLSSPPRVVCSVRDILVASAKPERTMEMLELVREFYDLVLVHGDPNLIPFDKTFPHASAIADRWRYTGYIVDRPAAALGAGGPPEVLVSAGGGAVSEPLLEAAFGARPESGLSHLTWRFLIGHHLPEDRFEAFRSRAGPGIVVERARSDFLSLIRRAALSISQGGYNTVMEVLDAGVRAVVVPYAGGLETEQTLRARLLAERGLIHVVEETELGAARIAEAVIRATAGPAPGALAFDTGGLTRSARLIGEALQTGSQLKTS